MTRGQPITIGAVWAITAEPIRPGSLWAHIAVVKRPGVPLHVDRDFPRNMIMAIPRDFLEKWEDVKRRSTP